jgi:hypothetical protein
MRETRRPQEPTMARPDYSTHRVADFIPQSVLHARRYELTIATYPIRRFIEPAVPEERALVPLPAKDPAESRSTCDIRLACFALAVAIAVTLYFLVPQLIGL